MSLFGRAALPAAVRVAGRELPVIAERRAGARGIRLRADPVQGAVRISLPARGGVAEAVALIAGHQAWLAEQVSRWPRPRPFAPGALIPFDGAELRIDWAETHPRTPRLTQDALSVGGPLVSLPARVQRWLGATALADLSAATHEIAADIGKSVAAVGIGDPRGRWGSCIQDKAGGRIRYSWRLILAPAAVRRHIVAHEVAHLVHANHGPDFYALLARLDGNQAMSRTWLKRHGAALHWVGRSEA